MQISRSDLLESVDRDLQILAELSSEIENRLANALLNDKDSYPNLKIWTNQLSRHVERAISATNNFRLLVVNGFFLLDDKTYRSCVQAESFLLESGLITYLRQTSNCNIPINYSVKPREYKIG